MTLTAAIILFFLVLDPLGNVPMFLSILKNLPPDRQRQIIVRELLIALLVLLLFMALGKYFLQLLHISEPALSVAGGLVLFLIAIRMAFPHLQDMPDTNDDEPFIVPLAIPLVAGPSAIATVLLVMSQSPERWTIWLTALIIAWGIAALILYFSTAFHRYLGRKGLMAMERLMGMLLTVIAVQMFMNGIADFIHTLN
ncbi:MAG: MarC family protein [Gammaproteobacteria bacterium]|nr:MarC family protein [Gammaproteobacteria bacterium]